MIVTLEITIGKGEAATTRTITIDPDELTLGFNEDVQAAQESGKWSDLNQMTAEMLGLTHAEVRQITNRQFKQVMQALAEASKEATTIPNA